jgi:hypothetical protein
MVRLDVVEILKKNGLWTDEFRTRMDMIEAVMHRDWNNPILKKNLTPEQLKQMETGAPQAGGAFPIPKALLEKAKSVASMPEAKDIAAQGASIAAMGMPDSLQEEAFGKLGSFKEGALGKLGSFKEGALGKMGQLASLKDQALGKVGEAQERLGNIKGAFDSFQSGKAEEGPEADARRAVVQAKIGDFIDGLPPVQSIKKKFEGKDPVTGLARELDYEKSDGFLTMVIKMLLNGISDIMSSPAFPIYVRAVFGIMFMLSYLQGLPIFGGLIRAALEITTFLVTTTGTSILSLGNMAGPIGHIIGLMFASVFFVLSAMISFSRKQFTDALVVSANLIPFVGMPISAALQRADIAGKKLYESQKQVYNSFIDLLAAVFQIKGRVRGGIRFSRRRKTIKKWRTMRHRQFGRR